MTFKMKNTFTRTALLTFSFLSVSPACFSNSQNTALDLASLQNLKGEEIIEDNKVAARLKAISEHALTIGAQNGYAYRFNELKSLLLNSSADLDKLYDFATVMKFSGEKDDRYLVPAVIQETKDLIRFKGNRSFEEIDVVYIEKKPARVASNPPNWREYLIFDLGVEVIEPSPYLLPKNDQESLIWSFSIQKGWEAGLNQAEEEMTYRVRSLASDFKGMLVYTRLTKGGKILRPVLREYSDNIVKGKNSMGIGKRTVQIVADSRFEYKADNWNDAVILDSRESYRLPDELKSLGNNVTAKLEN